MNVETSPAKTTEADEILLALTDLNFDEEGTIEEIAIGEAGEEILELKAPEIDEDFLSDLDLHTKRQEVYNTQTAAEMPDIEATRLAAASSVKVKSIRSVSKTPRTVSTAPRIEKDLAAIPAEMFNLSNVVDLSDAAVAEQNKTDVIAMRPIQVKIAEKFDNLFTSLNSGRKPSTYVMQIFEALESKKEMTSTDVVATFKAAGLADGTAQSQAGQIMVLFNVAGIAKRDGQKLTLRTDSKIADRIRAISAAPAPAPTAAPAVVEEEADPVAAE